MKTLKIKAIKDKSEVKVVGQANCSVAGQKPEYQPGQDCTRDCTAVGMPAHYLSPYT